jgi:hypothetical protein
MLVREIEADLFYIRVLRNFLFDLPVTSCSIFSALTPGHGVIATAVLTGVSGSLR